jgi:hypothetical protein
MAGSYQLGLELFPAWLLGMAVHGLATFVFIGVNTPSKRETPTDPLKEKPEIRGTRGTSVEEMRRRAEAIAAGENVPPITEDVDPGRSVPSITDDARPPQKAAAPQENKVVYTLKVIFIWPWVQFIPTVAVLTLANLGGNITGSLSVIKLVDNPIAVLSLYLIPAGVFLGRGMLGAMRRARSVSLTGSSFAMLLAHLHAYLWGIPTIIFCQIYWQYREVVWNQAYHDWQEKVTHSQSAIYPEFIPPERAFPFAWELCALTLGLMGLVRAWTYIRLINRLPAQIVENTEIFTKTQEQTPQEPQTVTPIAPAPPFVAQPPIAEEADLPNIF